MALRMLLNGARAEERTDLVEEYRRPRPNGLRSLLMPADNPGAPRRSATSYLAHPATINKVP